MTVAELIEVLKDCNPYFEVKVGLSKTVDCITENIENDTVHLYTEA